ncbi:DUF3168 domain-containing protein [Paremcibacter congregatus]|uniref:DUF3168 domain-containing protein n=1 Tax=Paremcibacter congregatus TaxID=2043170 RepID=UPI003A9431D5
MDAGWALQKAIFGVLDAALDCAVYDNVPAKSAMPYVVVGDDTLVPDDTKTSLGFEGSITLHVWSEAADGRREAKQLLGTIYTTLHDADLTIEDHSAVSCVFEFSETIPDRDGCITHGIARYRITFDQAA